MNTMKQTSEGLPDGNSAKKRKASAPAVAQLDSHIGKELRELYASILEEPIPDRFLSLIQSFEDHEQPAKKEGEA